MKRFRPFSSHLLIAATAIATAWGLVFAVSREKANLDQESAGANHVVESVRSSSAEPTPTNPAYCHIYDEAALNDSLLVAKGCVDLSDLWLRDSAGRERFISKAVTDAKFSPDGDKIVYATVDHEVVIETAAGARLAEISRAFDPVWGGEGTTVSFSLVPALDYPELQQRAIYDVASGRIAASSEPNFPSNTANPQPPKPNRPYDKK